MAYPELAYSAKERGFHRRDDEFRLQVKIAKSQRALMEAQMAAVKASGERAQQPAGDYIDGEFSEVTEMPQIEGPK